MDIYGDWYGGDSYKTILSEEMLPAKERVNEIENKIASLRPLLYEFVVVELYSPQMKIDDGNIAFFQTCKNRQFGTTDTLDVEVGLQVNGGTQLYVRDAFPDEAIEIFREICVDREKIDVSMWNRGGFYPKSANKTAFEIEEEKELTRLERIVELYCKGKLKGNFGKFAFAETVRRLAFKGDDQYEKIIVAILEGKNRYEKIRSLFEKFSYKPYIANAMGDIEYYGKLGAPNYEKAFQYYSFAASIGSLRAQYNLAKMYRYGLYAEKSFDMYAKIVQEVYEFYVDNNGQKYFPAITDILLELSVIEWTKGNLERSLELNLLALKSERISARCGAAINQTAVKLVHHLYEMAAFDASDMDIFDLLYVLEKPCSVRIAVNGKKLLVNAVARNETVVVECNGKCYRNAFSFLERFHFEDKLLTAYYDQVDYMEILHGPGY